MNRDRIILENFIESHPVDATRILERLKLEEIVSFLKEITPGLAVSFFHHLEQYTAVKCLELLNASQSAVIIEKLPLATAALFLRRMKKETRDSILKMITKEIASPLQRMLRYPNNTAGALMDPLIFTLPEDIMVKEALKRVQKRPQQAIYYLYIVNRNHVLSGVINLRELMLANPKEQLSSIMHTNVARLSAEVDFQAVLDHSGWLEYHALPVVDRSGTFLGAIRYETLRRIEKESKKTRVPRQAIVASTALGELYRIGLSGLLRSVAEGYNRRKE